MHSRRRVSRGRYDKCNLVQSLENPPGGTVAMENGASAKNSEEAQLTSDSLRS